MWWLSKHLKVVTNKENKGLGGLEPPLSPVTPESPPSKMEVQSLTRYARMSPKKVREVARTIQGRKAADAVNISR